MVTVQTEIRTRHRSVQSPVLLPLGHPVPDVEWSYKSVMELFFFFFFFFSGGGGRFFCVEALFSVI